MMRSLQFVMTIFLLSTGPWAEAQHLDITDPTNTFGTSYTPHVFVGLEKSLQVTLDQPFLNQANGYELYVSTLFLDLKQSPQSEAGIGSRFIPSDVNWLVSQHQATWWQSGILGKLLRPGTCSGKCALASPQAVALSRSLKRTDEPQTIRFAKSIPANWYAQQGIDLPTAHRTPRIKNIVAGEGLTESTIRNYAPKASRYAMVVLLVAVSQDKQQMAPWNPQKPIMLIFF